jgi:hypothetical protein
LGGQAGEEAGEEAGGEAGEEAGEERDEVDMEGEMNQAGPATPYENINVDQDIMVNHAASEEATPADTCLVTRDPEEVGELRDEADLGTDVEAFTEDVIADGIEPGDEGPAILAPVAVDSDIYHDYY